MTKPRVKPPALEIDADTINQLAKFGDRTRGIALRWMISTLQGATVAVEEERAQIGERFGSVCAKLKPMLDPEKLEAGVIVINFVNAKLERQRHISLVRSQANASRKSKGARVSPKSIPQSEPLPSPAPLNAQTTKAKTKPVIQTTVSKGNAGLSIVACPFQVERLQAMGVTAKQSLMTIGRLTREYGEAAVAQALDRMQQRKLAKPIAYLEASLANSKREQAESIPVYVKGEPPADGTLPRGIKRHQRVPPGSPYQFLGWTCKNHPRAADGARKKIWRTDSGSLAYKRAETNEKIPDFNEDAGCYEEE